MLQLRSIKDAGDLRGKYVIVRSSFNIPLEDGGLRNTFRLLRALPTLRYLKEQGARTVILSHIGREPQETLLPVQAALEKEISVVWGGVVTGPEFAERHSALEDGALLLAENLRQDSREEENDPGFAALLASFGEIYVNDGFAEVHRAHASTVGVAKLLPAYAGLTLEEEVTKLATAMQPHSPSLFLLGGAKFETKMPLIEKYLAAYDQVFIGGALVHDVMKAKGYEVGRSLVSDVSLVGAPFLDSEKLLLPLDVIVENPEGSSTVRAIDAVEPEDRIVDAGPQTVAMLEPYIKNAATILWNGTFGHYESGYAAATEAVAACIAESAGNSVVGGGDTVAAIEKLGLNERFGFVSIGGGAMLAYLEHGTTEALELLRV